MQHFVKISPSSLLGSDLERRTTSLDPGDWLTRMDLIPGERGKGYLCAVRRRNLAEVGF
jgi:hypothetical protein